MPRFETTARYDLVICDVDGCLSPESSASFDLANLVRVAEHNRLAQTHRDRPIVTLCTGRPEPFAEAMCRLIANESVPCVAENGAWLYDPGTNYYELDPAITAEDIEIRHDASRLMHERYASHGVTQQPGKAAAVTLYHRDPEYLTQIFPDVRDEFARRGWPFRVSMTWLYINCDLDHISKSTGIERLLAATGIDASRTAGIGDTMSDLAIAHHAAWFACPANAHDDIKAHADYVSPQVEVAGVVDILGRL